MALVRYILEIPYELEKRIHLRSKMMCSGLGNIFEVIKCWAPDESAPLLVHVNAIEEEAIMDAEEFERSCNGDYKAQGIDIDDPRQALDVVMNCLKEDKIGTDNLKSIMRQLIITSSMDDLHLRYK
jgi:hypothetical protein